MSFLNIKISHKKVISEIFDSRLFWFGLALKVILSAFFASKFLTDLFLPFISFYTNSGFSDPYQQFFLEGKGGSFPYPSLMLWIVCLPYYFFLFIINNFSSLSPFLSIFALRIPILIADFVILVIFTRWLKYSLKRLLIFYWLSPVLIYINYIHGQLDCIPIAILITSLYFLFKERLILSSFILAASVACKTNIILAVPFFFIYLVVKKVDYKNIAACVLLFISTIFVINIPYIFSEGFHHMVLFNNEQSKIFDVSYSFSSDRLFYFIPAVYFVLLIRSFMIKGYNRDVFIMFLGFSFGVLNLFIPPMQGWYYWVIPFFSYFYIKQKNAPILLFYALQSSYFLYFFTIQGSDYLEVFQLISPEIAYQNNFYTFLQSNGWNADKMVNLSFTILQTSLLLNCFWIYRSGISSFLKHKLVSKPYLIGISGDSGVGKTTLVSSLEGVFGEKNITKVCGDDMHRWERGHEKWRSFTHLNPSANKLYGEVSFLRALKDGKKIARRIYDHGKGRFTNPKNIEARKIVIFEGLHSFYVEPVRNLFDVRIFVKPEKQLRVHWKIIRDQMKRGYSKSKVLEQLKQRENDSEKFISSQEKYADIKIELLPTKEINNIGDKDEEIILSLRISCSNSVNVEPFVDVISKINSLKVDHGFDEDDQQFISIAGSATLSQIKLRGDILLGQDFEEISLKEPCWSDDLTGLVQIFLAFYIIKTELDDEAKNN